jgi:hypothetical protein
MRNSLTQLMLTIIYKSTTKQGLFNRKALNNVARNLYLFIMQLWGGHVSLHTQFARLYNVLSTEFLARTWEIHRSAYRKHLKQLWSGWKLANAERLTEIPADHAWKLIEEVWAEGTPAGTKTELKKQLQLKAKARWYDDITEYAKYRLKRRSILSFSMG